MRKRGSCTSLPTAAVAGIGEADIQAFAAVSTDGDVLQTLAHLFRDRRSELDKLERILDVVNDRGGADLESAKAAIDDVLDSYENRLRVGLVGVARARFERVVRMSRFVQKVEGEIQRPERLGAMKDTDVIRLLEVCQKTMVSDLAFIDQVVEMRLRLLDTESLVRARQQISDAGDVLEIGGQMIRLSPESRDRLRSLVDRLTSDARRPDPPTD
ncbi:MAG: hypothetical protein A2Y38_21595 [Spirochaetes bacterium GWB1_59_5]|nr:MAG: hypothetical protein A2Y38_21595 [Spirochaetes bacterium GWB1_59_5]